ncbi:MAG: sulfotransferase [Acidimicrobiales bacterium]
MVSRRPILVVGVPRSGTTWTANVLGATEGVRLVAEPDNEKLSAPAVWAKRRLGRFPVLDDGDHALRYLQLWRWAFTGANSGLRLRLAQHLLRDTNDDDLEALAQGRITPWLRVAGILAALPRGAPSTARCVVKSVHACLGVEWLAAQFEIDVLVILRHPANVLASWLDLDLPDRDRDLGALRRVQERFVRPWGVPSAGTSALERAVWELGLLTCALEQAAAKHPEWHLRTHEQLCTDPEERFRVLARDLGLAWGPGALDVLRSSDKPGTGFTAERNTSLLADSWRRRLGSHEIDTLRRVLSPFPLRTWDLNELRNDGGNTGGPAATA